MASSFHAAPHMDPKLLLQRKLGSAWSSPELVALLQTRPGFLSDVLCVFRGLEQPVRLRVLLAFLAFDEISVLPKDSVLAVLDEAAADSDEWVKVMAAVVRDWLFGSAEGEPPPSAEVAADVLAKCRLLAEQGQGQQQGQQEEAQEGEDEEARATRAVDPEPYFCPIEYLYLSEPIIQRHHRAAPLTRKENVHFAVGDLSEVEMEPISDTPLAASGSGSGLPHSSSSGSLQHANSFGSTSHRPPPPSSSSASASAAAASQAVARPRPPLGAPRGAASLLGAAQRPQEKPRLKVIKLDEVKVKTDHAKVAASNEALSLEFGTQPLQLDSARGKAPQAAAAPPPPPAPLAPAPAQAAAGAAGAESAADAAKKRSAAEAMAGLAAPSAAASTAAAVAAGAASVDPLSDYHRMKVKSNRLTPQDDERIRLFYLHGAQGNPHPEQREVKIKINEEEVAREDGSRVKETLYISLNYDTRKAVLSRKVSKPKTAAP